MGTPHFSPPNFSTNSFIFINFSHFPISLTHFVLKLFLPPPEPLLGLRPKLNANFRLFIPSFLPILLELEVSTGWRWTREWGYWGGVEQKISILSRRVISLRPVVREVGYSMHCMGITWGLEGGGDVEWVRWFCGTRRFCRLGGGGDTT